MQSLIRKLKSESGASILLALLFFMIAMLVGASVLMAATSNAGKTRSNKQEQQAYLALSSAVRLVTDDIVDAEYHANYSYKEVKESPAEGGSEVTVKTYTQTTGTFSSGLSNYLLKDLDALFAAYLKECEDDSVGIGGTVKSHYVPRAGLPSLSGGALPPHTWEITVSGAPDELKDFKVKVELQVFDNYRMELKAYFSAVPAAYGTEDDYKDFVMNAELTPKENAPTLAGGETDNKVYFSTPMTWKLGWITGAE